MGGCRAGSHMQQCVASKFESRAALGVDVCLLQHTILYLIPCGCYLPPCWRNCRLCLLQYEREQYSSTAFMDLFNKLNVTLSDEQLSVFGGAHGRLPACLPHAAVSEPPRCVLMMVAQRQAAVQMLSPLRANPI